MEILYNKTNQLASLIVHRFWYGTTIYTALGSENCVASEFYKPREYQKVKLLRLKQILRATVYVARLY
jgi:hypothetical protein